jgi:hypothetical protein
VRHRHTAAHDGSRMNQKSGEESGEGRKRRFQWLPPTPSWHPLWTRARSLAGLVRPSGLEGDCKDVFSPNRAWGHPESA